MMRISLPALSICTYLLTATVSYASQVTVEDIERAATFCGTGHQDVEALSKAQLSDLIGVDKQRVKAFADARQNEIKNTNALDTKQKDTLTNTWRCYRNLLSK